MKLNLSCFNSEFLDDHCIQEINMRLKPEEYSKIKFRLKCLENKAPAFSSMKLVFSYQNNLIKGELSIYGAKKKFQSAKQGDDPWRIYKQMEQDVCQQISQWKRIRFLNGRTNIAQDFSNFSDFNDQLITEGRYI